MRLSETRGKFLVLNLITEVKTQERRTRRNNGKQMPSQWFILNWGNPISPSSWLHIAVKPEKTGEAWRYRVAKVWLWEPAFTRQSVPSNPHRGEWKPRSGVQVQKPSRGNTSGSSGPSKRQHSSLVSNPAGYDSHQPGCQWQPWRKLLAIASLGVFSGLWSRRHYFPSSGCTVPLGSQGWCVLSRFLPPRIWEHPYPLFTGY